MRIHKVHVASLLELVEEVGNTPPYSIVVLSNDGFTHITKLTHENHPFSKDPRILISEPSMEKIDYILQVIRDGSALSQLPVGYAEQASFHVLGDQRLLADYPDVLTLQ